LLAPNGAPLVSACRRFGIGSPLEQAHFYAQMAEESEGFTRMSENLNYSYMGLLRTFKTHFTPVEAARYARHPEAIANRAYANRMGNGNEASGDGWRYRGRGWPEITGKANYARISEDIFGDARLLIHPELLEDPNNAALAAGHFWIDNNCGLPAMHDDIEGVTEKVNGGLNGLEERRAWLVKFKAALGVPV
jgi:putative chitinase